MAGRGTDIVLGGNLEFELQNEDSPEKIAELKSSWQESHDRVVEAGGLYIIGSERHDSRRIDNQLRGRAGRQGDPGASLFYLSLEDDLMRVFVPKGMRDRMKQLWTEEGEPLKSKILSNVIERAQAKVENHNFEIRKNLLEYDDISNEQRTIIYQLRFEILKSENFQPMFARMRQAILSQKLNDLSAHGFTKPAIETFKNFLESLNSLSACQDFIDAGDFSIEELEKLVLEEWETAYLKKIEQMQEMQVDFERYMILEIVDQLWKEHLYAIDSLRQGIHLRAYAQKQPKQEYRQESFILFERLIADIQYEIVRFFLRLSVEVKERSSSQEMPSVRQDLKNASFTHEALNHFPEISEGSAKEVAPSTEEAPTPFVRREQKVKRNDPCVCGSGKKYKKCCYVQTKEEVF